MAQAVAWSTKASEQGIVDAQTNLAVFYRTGDGVQKDGEKATYWATKAAEGGNLNAAFNLGNMYEVGDAVPANGSETAKWYLKAAQGGHPEAQYRLGIMYFQGVVIEQNFKTSAQWLRRASDNKHDAAKFHLAKMLEAGWLGPPDIDGAAKLYLQAGLAGHAEALVSYLALQKANPSALTDTATDPDEKRQFQKLLDLFHLDQN